MEILKEKGPGEKFGEALGQLGQGFGQSFAGNVQNRLNEMQQLRMNELLGRQNMRLEQEKRNMMNQQLAPTLTSIPGPDGQPLFKSPQQVQQFINLPKELQNSYFKNLMSAPGNEAYASALTQLLGGAPQQAQPLAQLDQLGQPQQAEAQQMGLGIQPQPGAFQLKPGMNAQQMKDVASMALSSKQHTETMDLARSKEMARREELGQSKQLDEKRHWDKTYRPQYDELRKKSEGAEEANLVLDKMLTASESGELPSPQWATFVEAFSKTSLGQFINPNELLGTSAQVYNKEATKLFNNFKNIVGGRLTNFDFQQLMKGIAQLTNDPDARRQIIHELKTLNDIYNAEYDTARSIQEENEGYLPKNFDSILKKRSQERITQLTKQFKEQAKPKIYSGMRVKSLEDVQGVPEGAIAIHRKTGQKQIRRGGKWQPM